MVTAFALGVAVAVVVVVVAVAVDAVVGGQPKRYGHYLHWSLAGGSPTGLYRRLLPLVAASPPDLTCTIHTHPQPIHHITSLCIPLPQFPPLLRPQPPWQLPARRCLRSGSAHGFALVRSLPGASNRLASFGKVRRRAVTRADVQNLPSPRSRSLSASTRQTSRPASAPLSTNMANTSPPVSPNTSSSSLSTRTSSRSTSLPRQSSPSSPFSETTLNASTSRSWISPR
jgi:hypothetical protein